jgi:hypothetical protein
MRPSTRERSYWSLIVTASNIYFTGPKPDQYYYLPAKDFKKAGQASGKFASIAPKSTP